MTVIECVHYNDKPSMLFTSRVKRGRMRQSQSGSSHMIRLRVKELADERGLNMAQLARKADIDQRTLRRIYRDPTQEISTLVLGKLATALNVSPGDLIEVIDDQ